ncbi:MAG: FAD-dependent oxidoreductase [Akkermansiaceae bacterium]|nr:FAD-dependent oxidoreductase [Akkermansiaceae bacterium]
MENTSPGNVVLGAGVAGLSAAHHLHRRGEPVILCEQGDDWGGLCGFFTLGGFRFDRFVHFSFAPEEELAARLEASSPTFAHPPVSYNYWHGFWLKHPAQNNLAPLPAEEKVRIIEDFVQRPHKDPAAISSYDEWLRVQYGHYFAEHFPFAYTRKYWCREPRELETRWVGQRMRISPLAEVLRGAFAEQAENFYYTQAMRYPKQGGFRSLFDSTRRGLDIRFGKKVTAIDPAARRIFFADGDSAPYTRLISSLPLPEMPRLVPHCPPAVQQAAEQLHWTCGFQVSLGFRRPDVAQHLWFYIYDEDVPPARVYSPSLKSPDNAPAGCSSLQAEIFFADRTPLPDPARLLKRTISVLRRICHFTEADLLVSDIRYEPYANVTFTPEIYEARATIRQWLSSQGIETIGRFGLWDYLWSHQAYASGQSV